jgi:O-acetyl-ADP-ribose deacetylase (regulator of RNase III)
VAFLEHALFHRIVNGSDFFLRLGNIVEMEIDAIVTAANSRLAGGGGVDAAIHHAGGPSIMAQCRQFKGCPTGKAVVTGAGHLKAKMVIHAVGPIWSGGHQGEAELLRSAYHESLLQAVRHSARSILFPSISTGTYGYPIAEAAPIAIKTVTDFLRQSDQLEGAGMVLFAPHDYEVYDEAARQVLDRPLFGCYWSYFQESGGLYLHLLHLNDAAGEQSSQCARWLRRLAEEELYWEEDTLRLLEERGWREHLGAAVSFYLCSRPHPAILDALWKALSRGSWVSPQLLVVLSQRDPHFAPKLDRLLTRGVQAESSGNALVDHVEQGPGDDNSRLGKIANAALGLARSGVWQPTPETETRARQLAGYDQDGGDDIAASWLKKLRLFEHS